MNIPGTPPGMPMASPGSPTFVHQESQNGSITPEQESPSEAPEMAVRARLLQLAGQIGPFLLNALNQGSDGAAFAEGLTTLYGGLAYEQIAALGQEGIMQALQAHPQLWPQLAPIQGRLEQFVEEFLGFGKDDGEPEEGEPTEEEAAEPAITTQPEAALSRRRRSAA
jgi:hypothetical protein